MSDKFDLEQQLLDFWTITDKIDQIEKHGIAEADQAELVRVYEYKFTQLWATFEAMVADGQFV